MTTQTDVLAWLDSLYVTDADGALTNRKWPEAQAARAAVAELVDLMREVLEHADRVCDERYGGERTLEAQTLRDRVAAALANMGPQS